ncbi:MAG: flagellar basal body rod protein FlgB [Fibrobacteria bacterium]|nr:flagellar basal body rod protein FlgB [Fibrobacteria bacterium]
MILKQVLYRQTAMPVIEKSLDAAMLRDKAIANNLANVQTPAYKRIDVSFEESLKKALDAKRPKGTKTDDRHMSVGKPEINEIMPMGYRAEDKTLPGEINNVDIDLEMAKMADNQLKFFFSTKFMSNYMDDFSDIIKGRIR